MQVGELFAELGLDTKKYDQGLKKAESDLKETGRKLDGEIKNLGKRMEEGLARSAANISASLKNVGRSMSTFVTLPIVAIGAAAFKAGTDFEAAMSNIKALGGETGESMKKLHDLALEMGNKTKYSAVEAAQGIEELKKAGVTTEQILSGGLNGALSLAAAGEISVADAAEVASTALNAFSKDNMTVMDAANLLAGAADASATDVGELRQGLSMVSAVAASMGLNFEDTATALAVFAQAGLKGSDAGTSLKTMLMNLQPTTKAQIGMFERLNLLTEDGSSLFYDENGHMKKLADIAWLLKDRMKGMTDAQRALALETMFGSDAIRAANILYENGADGVKNMDSAMRSVTADEVAKEKMNNLKGSLDNLMSSLETWGVKIYKMNGGPLKGLVDGLTGIVNGFSELPGPVQQGIVLFLGVAAALGPVLYVAGTIGTVALPMVGTALAAVCGPAGAVIGAIALLSLVFKRMLDTSPAMREWARGISISLYNYVINTINGGIGAVNLLLEGLNRLTSWNVPKINQYQEIPDYMASYDPATMGIAGERKRSHFAGGTNFAPGGVALVGERGPELVTLPRGAQVIANERTTSALDQGQLVRHEGTIIHQFQTNDKQVVARIAEEITRGNRRLPQRVPIIPDMA